MCADVHTVGRHGHIDFLTVGTLSRFFVVDTAMGLPMASQVAGGAVPLSAFWANMIVTDLNLAPRFLYKFVEVVVQLLEIVMTAVEGGDSGPEVLGEVWEVCPVDERGVARHVAMFVVRHDEFGDRQAVRGRTTGTVPLVGLGAAHTGRTKRLLIFWK